MGIQCTCVPGVVAAGPWQLSREGGEEVEESPGQDRHVADTSIENDQQAGISQAWKQQEIQREFRFKIYKPLLVVNL